MPRKQEDEFKKALESALRSLSICDRSRKDLEQRLLKKGYSSEVMTKVIFELESMGYIDDSRYALKYATDAIRIKNRGPRAIRYELQQKGIEREIIDEAIIKALEEYDELDAARRALRKRQVRSPALTETKRLIDYLRRKGFSYDIIKAVMKESRNEDGV